MTTNKNLNPFLSNRYPCVNAAGRVANELIHRHENKSGYLVSWDWCARLIGIPKLVLIFQLFSWLEHGGLGLKSTNVLDLRHVWAWVRYAPESQVLCFSLNDVQPFEVEGCVGTYYDMIDVWKANWVEVDEFLTG